MPRNGSLERQALPSSSLLDRPQGSTCRTQAAPCARCKITLLTLTFSALSTSSVYLVTASCAEQRVSFPGYGPAHEAAFPLSARGAKFCTSSSTPRPTSNLQPTAGGELPVPSRAATRPACLHAATGRGIVYTSTPRHASAQSCGELAAAGGLYVPITCSSSDSTSLVRICKRK